MENEIVFVTNTQPKIIHLPDTVRRTTSKDVAGNTVVTPISLGDGKAIPPSVPKMKDGKPEGGPVPTAVDKVYWDSVKDNRQVQTWLRLGWLSLNTEAGAGISLEIIDLSGYNVTTAVTIVGGENNPRLLAAWAKNESREDVKKALASRLEEIKGKAKLPPLTK